MLIRTSANLTLAAVVAASLCLGAAPAPAKGSSQPQPGPVPTNCPSSSKPTRVAQAFGPGVGGPTVWAIGWPNPTATKSLGVHTGHGWALKFLWAMAPGTTEVVRVRGWNLQTGRPIWFSYGYITAPAATKVMILNPKQGGTGAGGWGSWPSDEYLPSAGCYVFFAQWTRGAELIPFAAGH